MQYDSLDDALNATGVRAEPPQDPDGLRVSRVCGHHLAPPYLCRRGCGATIRQAWWKGDRIELVLDVEGPYPPGWVSPAWSSWWWTDRIGLIARLARFDSEHAGDELYVMHPCESTQHRPAPPPTRKAPPHMTAPQFGTPGNPGEGVKNDELMGRLLLITVTEKKTGLITSNGPADVVVADIVELDGPAVGAEHPGNFLFGKVLYGQLSAGVTYLGWIEKGTAQTGKSAPWVFVDANTVPAAVATAQAFLAYKAGQTPAATPAAAAPAPAASFPPAAAAAPAATPAPPWAA